MTDLNFLPQRQSLVAQTASCLRDGIAAGRWRDWLPAERTLARELSVGRNTLRRALAALEGAKLLRPEPGRGHRVTGRPRRPRGVTAATVGLLIPHAFGQLRPTTIEWIDRLREQLADQGTRLQVHAAPSCYARRPAAALARICDRQPAECWIPVLSTEPMQEWFATHSRPCVVAGSNFPGIELPSVDLDHAATARHAAGVLIARGHRRIALLLKAVYSAGDLRTAEGFLTAARSASRPAEAVIIHTGESREEAIKPLANLRNRGGPTGLLVANPHRLLAIAGWLAAQPDRGAGVALLSRDDDPFLRFLKPRPPRYRFDPAAFARAIGASVGQVLADGAPARRHVRLLAEFDAGDGVVVASA